ncbi:MAG: pitrilysin family protein [Pseudomonadota bacterium]
MSLGDRLRRLAVHAGALACLLFFLPSAASALAIERVVSPGGIEAWLARDASVPVIAVEIAFRESGSAGDPAGKEGLAYLVSGLLDEGAGPMDSQAFREALEKQAISLSFDANLDDFLGSLKTLRENHVAAFDLFRLALSEPRFDQDAVARIRNQVLTTIAARLDDPDATAQRAWLRTVFPDHPYGKPQQGTAASVEAVVAKDLRAFVGRNLARDNLIIGVAGDITAAELAPLLDRTFGALPAHRPEATPIPETKAKGEGAETVIEKPIPQSVVVFGQAGVKRDDPDYYAAQVLNHILGGGGLQSRLAKEIRGARGLAYAVSTYLYPLDRAGLWVGQLATRNDRVKESLDLLRAEWKRMAETPVTKEELEDAKTYITGAFPLSLDSTGRIASVLLAIQKYHLGIDYFERRNAYIAAVSADDLRRLAKRLLNPDALAVVVVGSPKGLAAPGAAE